MNMNDELHPVVHGVPVRVTLSPCSLMYEGYGLQVDVVVTDYKMPRMDGAELARRLHAWQPHLPVLLITGYTGPTDDVLHLPRLAKPFGQAEVAEALAGLFATDEKVVRFPGRSPTK